MSSTSLPTPSFTRKLQSLFAFQSPQRRNSSTAANVEAQTEVSHTAGNIWNIVLNADTKALEQLLADDAAHSRAVLYERGAVGELPIHMCYIFHSAAHLAMADRMVSVYPDLLTAIYTGVEYYGENILHIAIINRDVAAVTNLVKQCRKLLDATATGNFFKLGSACYYGEYPLAFAACTGQREMVHILLEAGANLNLTDSNGNTILHMLVLHNRDGMYSYIKQQWQERESAEASRKRLLPMWKRKNGDELTPFTLAAKTGNVHMFSFLLEEERELQWSYGPVSCYLYPLEQVDLPLSHYDKHGNSKGIGALELIVNEAHLDLLMHPRMIDLVQKKWEAFASTVFFQRFISILLYLAIFTITTIVRQTMYFSTASAAPPSHYEELNHAHNTSANSSNDAGGTSTVFTSSVGLLEYFPLFLTDLTLHPISTWHLTVFPNYPVWLYAGELIVVAGGLYKGWKEVAEMIRSGSKSYWSAAVSNNYRHTLGWRVAVWC